MIVSRYGVRNRGCTRASHGGSSRSRLIANATRVWPSISVMITTVRPIRMPKEMMNSAAGSPVAAIAAAAGASTPSCS